MRSKELAKIFAYFILISFFLIYGNFSNIQLIFAATPIVFTVNQSTPATPTAYNVSGNISFSLNISVSGGASVNPNGVIFQLGRNITTTYTNFTKCTTLASLNCTWNISPSIFLINFTQQTYDKAGLSNYTWYANDSSGAGNKTNALPFTYAINQAIPTIILSNSTASISTSGLVGYWKFNEGTGSTASDSSGNGNTGTVSGAAWAIGQFGSALSFNGNGAQNNVSIKTSSSLNITNAITVETWVNLNGPSQTMIRKNNTDWLFEFGSANCGASGANYPQWLVTAAGIPTCLFANNNPIPYNQWHQVVGTYDGSTMNMFVDGILVNFTSKTGTLQLANSNLFLGGWTNEIFNGTIDEVQIWNRALTASEIDELYQSQVTYTTQTTFTGSNCPTSAQGGADVTCNLTRNMAYVDNPDIQTLNSGFYYYIYNTSGGQNYTISSILLPLNITGVSGTSSGSIQIYPGWNLISFPYSDSTSLVGTCQPSILTYYNWNPSTKRWNVITGQPPAGSGFWVYSNVQCAMQYTGSSQIISIPLSAGWNQIGTFSVSRLVSTLNGCTFTQGPFYYNTQSSTWQYPASSLDSGNGYWVNVNSGCTLT